jgi:hypothetical protein
MTTPDDLGPNGGRAAQELGRSCAAWSRDGGRAGRVISRIPAPLGAQRRRDARSQSVSEVADIQVEQLK